MKRNKSILQTLFASGVSRNQPDWRTTASWQNPAGIEAGLNMLLPSLEPGNQNSLYEIFTDLIAETHLFPTTYLVCGRGSEDVGRIVADVKGLRLVTEKDGALYTDGSEVKFSKEDKVTVFVTCLTEADILAPLLQKVSSDAWVKQIACVLDYDLPIARENMKDMGIGTASLLTVPIAMEVGFNEGKMTEKDAEETLNWVKKQKTEIESEIHQ